MTQPMIFETIVTTQAADGSVHIVPLGIRNEDDRVVLAPFRPSSTLDNIVREGHAVVNLTDEVKIFAGCLCGRRTWPTVAASRIPGRRLEATRSHLELALERIEDDEQRPRLICREVHSETHAPFRGFNRAQAAVIEACILVSRLHMLAEAKVRAEVDYLTIAIGKTAGPDEREAWGWLLAKIDSHYGPAGTPAAAPSDNRSC